MDRIPRASTRKDAPFFAVTATNKQKRCIHFKKHGILTGFTGFTGY